jgi:hypothetical protein
MSQENIKTFQPVQLTVYKYDHLNKQTGLSGSPLPDSCCCGHGIHYRKQCDFQQNNQHNETTLTTPYVKFILKDV